MNYKVKVDNEKQAEEAFNMLLSMGYKKPHLDQTNIGFVASHCGIAYRELMIHWESYDGKEISLDQLKDLVVLHRNDVTDATHESTDKQSKYFLSSGNKWYLWVHEMSWYEIDSPSYGYVAIGTKEYLDPLNNYKLINAYRKEGDDWVEIPSGAKYYAVNNGAYMFFENKRFGLEWSILWQRQKDDAVVKSASDKVRSMIKENREGAQKILDKQKIAFGVDLAKEGTIDYTVESTLSQRQSQYGEFKDVASTTEALFKLSVNENFTDDQRMAMYMICSKIARLANGDHNHKDSWHDIAGYATLVDKSL